MSTKSMIPVLGTASSTNYCVYCGKSYTRKTSILEYFPEGTYGIILLAKRTRATQGAIPYVIAMIGGEVFKISADCISFVE